MRKIKDKQTEENKLKKELENKLAWAELEKKKGLTSIEILVSEINKLQLQCQKLDGAIAALKDILKIKTENK